MSGLTGLPSKAYNAALRAVPVLLLRRRAAGGRYCAASRGGKLAVNPIFLESSS
jgi:hypothetical protein